jgi:acetyl-CoA C-acetyltransferase
VANRNTSTKVAIVGMGCTRFGDHWDKSADDLIIDAVKELSDTSGVLASNVGLAPPSLDSLDLYLASLSNF